MTRARRARMCENEHRVDHIRPHVSGANPMDQQAFDFESLIVDIPDYPQPGVVFKDITPLMADPKGFAAVVDAIADVGNAGDVWVFIIAPLIGAAIAWAVWKYVLCDPKKEA